MNNLEIKQKILDKIIENQKIIIVRHVNPDGDCVGGSLGLKEIIKETYPKKIVKVIADDKIEYLDFLGEEDNQEEQEFYTDALIISVDTASKKRISNSYYMYGKELIKIDHHIEVDKYGDINWVEDSRSSLCEMIVDFYNTFKDVLVLNDNAAKSLYTGMVTDSGRFKFSLKGETLRLASILIDKGLDTETIYAHLYLKEFNLYKIQSEIYRKTKMTENGVAYIHITKRMQKKYNLSTSDASAMVSLLDGIKGCLIWLAFIDKDDNTTRVRLRSRFVHINQIAEKYNGGGHAKASGATVTSKKEMQNLIQDADLTIKEFKENNSEWL